MISIIMSVFNVEKYLEQCLNSIFNQTYKNIELIIINDGSTDKSKDIIDKYKEKYSNIVYIEQQNRGLSEARNLGLKISKGQYILYVDSDDYLETTMLEYMINKIEQDNSEMVIIGHNEFYDNYINKNYNVYLDISDEKIYSGLEVADLMLRCKIMGVAWNKLYKRELLIRDEFIFESGRYTQDWYPIFKHITKLEKVSFVNKPLYKYRLSNTSTTSKKNQKRLEDYYHAVNSILEYIYKVNLKVDKISLEIFKATTFCNIISLYFKINENNKGIYNKFKQSKFNKNKTMIKRVIFLEDISLIKKIHLVSWEMKIYRQVLWGETKLREIKSKRRFR